MKYTLSDGFLYYIEYLGNKDYRKQLASKENLGLLHSISEEKSSYKYAPGKWSIKKIIGHLSDHERIMTYRMLCFSRKDSTLLPGYDQDMFVENSRFDEQSFAQLLNDFENVRTATLSFIRSLSEEQLQLTGKAWKFELTIEDFLRSIAGHEQHHIDVIRERYLR